MKKKVLWSTVAASIMLVSWGFLASNNSIKAKEIPTKETSVSTSDSEKKTEKNSPLKPELRGAWGAKPSAPLAIFGPTRPDLYKSMIPGVAESFPNKYSFQPKITALTDLYRKRPGRAEELIKPGSWPPYDSLKQTDVGYYLLGTHMGIKNGRWIDLKLEYADIGPVKSTTETVTVGTNKTLTAGMGTVHLAFAVASSKNTEPIFRMSFIDHETGEPVKMDSGHVTFNDIDYTEWMKVTPTGSGKFDYISARNDNGILTDTANFTSEQITMISPEDSNVADDDFTRFFTIGYSNVDSLDIQYYTGGTAINLSQLEVPEAMFELETPSLVSDVDGNLEDEVITSSLIQPIPYRASIGKLTSLAFEGTVDDSMSFIKSDIQVYDKDNKNITTNFISALDPKNPQKFTLVALPAYTDTLVNKTDQLRIDIKTTLNKTNDAYKKYQNNATGQLTIPFQMKLKYANAGGVDSGNLIELDSNIAFGHINLKKITINYKDDLGKSLQASQTKLGFLGESVTYSAPTIEGYNLKSPKEVDGTDNFTNTEKNVDYVYEKVTPNVTLEKSVDKAKAQPGETLHYKLNIGSVQETPKDLDTRTISVEYWDDLGQKIRTDSTYTMKKGSSYDFSEIPAVEGFDGIAATVTSNAKGTVSDDDIVIKISGFKATLDMLVQKKVRYVDENDQPISDDVTYLGRDKYIPNYSVKAKVIPGYVISDGQESYPVTFDTTSPDEYVFKYRSSRNYNSLKITEVLDSKLENPTNFTWKSKEAVEIPNDSITYDEATRKITATSPTDGIAFNHESTIEFDAKVASTATVNYVISQTANFKAGYLADGTIDVSTKTPAETLVTLESQVIVKFIDESADTPQIADELTFTQEIGTTIDLSKEKSVQDVIEKLKKKYEQILPAPGVVEFKPDTTIAEFKFKGRLTYVSSPEIFDFGLNIASFKKLRVDDPTIIGMPLIVSDTRAKSPGWSLKVKLTEELLNEDGKTTLRNAIRYKSGETETILSNQALTVVQKLNPGEYDVSKDWSAAGDGLKLEIAPGAVHALGKYHGEILFELGETP
ncbi:hypothetical protein CI088_09970 [Enterococcus plantarum]|uniref:MucBP domain-containing protein n=1 Tax=Enterococcus plantarum TaxID=1077675 RepID=A0A2W3ZVD8_9ENTE|nr:MucBP domain-containing protein [Enterococcus plantarum]PZL72813.1 hypothetical protein CI088_09970 [Enterococcus plantarum]